MKGTLLYLVQSFKYEPYPETLSQMHPEYCLTTLSGHRLAPTKPNYTMSHHQCQWQPRGARSWLVNCSVGQTVSILGDP